MVTDFPFDDVCVILIPVERSFLTSVSITGPASPPPNESLKPRETVAFRSVPLFVLDVFALEKLNDEPFSIVAELPEPGGSRKTKSGNSGPLVTKVCVPSATPPKIIPSAL